MKSILCLLVVAGSLAAAPATFVFDSGEGRVEGIVSLPSGKPRALILYFHRGIEDRSAASAWGALLCGKGYAVAGYTATGSAHLVEEARAAAKELRSRKELAQAPLVAMGASLGTRAALGWFAADPEVKALILIVPGEAKEGCAQFAKSAGRPVMMIQAEKDEVVAASAAETLRKCRPQGSALRILPGKGHRFPPSDISGVILQWLNANLRLRESEQLLK